MNISNKIQLSGNSFPVNQFNFSESHKVFDQDVVQQLLMNNAVAHLVRDYIPKSAAKKLYEEFRNKVSCSRADNVPAIEMGASHYGKSTDQYLTAVKKSQLDFVQLYEQAGFNLESQLHKDLNTKLNANQTLRVAEHDSNTASRIRASSWSGTANGFKLAIHEDASQLNALNQKGFEIQTVQHPVAINVYPNTPLFGGELRIFNLQPNIECKHALQVNETGYPYPVELMRGIQYLDIKPEPGDLILLNGSFLHGVIGWDGEAMQRVVFNGFIGLSSKANTVLWWT